MTWIPRIPYNRGAERGAQVRHRRDGPVPEPVPALPPAGAASGPGALDLSPIVAIIVLIIVGEIIVDLIRG